MKPLKVKRRMPLSYKLGEGLRQYRGGNVRYCTLVVTEECNLRCKYCYQLHKNSRNVMSIETAKKAIDFFIDTLDPSDGVVLEFTGGECTLEMDLVREATNYFRSGYGSLGSIRGGIPI